MLISCSPSLSNAEHNFSLTLTNYSFNLTEYLNSPSLVVGRVLWSMPTFVALFSGILAQLIRFNYLALTHRKETADTRGRFVSGPIGNALLPFPKIVLLQWEMPE